MTLSEKAHATAPTKKGVDHLVRGRVGHRKGLSTIAPDTVDDGSGLQEIFIVQLHEFTRFTALVARLFCMLLRVLQMPTRPS